MIKLVKINKERKILIAVAGIFAISFVAWCFSSHTQRCVMFFQSSDLNNRLCLEERYLPESRQNSVELFVDELLLGPMTAHCRYIFSPGTRAESCFVRGKVLYVNLSDDVLQQSGNASAIKDGTEIFRKNILDNFRNINRIEMFVDGKYVSWD